MAAESSSSWASTERFLSFNPESSRAVFSQAPAIQVRYSIGVGLLTWLYWGLAPRGWLLVWLAAASAVWGLRAAHYLRFRRQPEADAQTLLRWGTIWRAIVLATAAVYGLAGWLFWDLGTPYTQHGLALVLFSAFVGGAQFLPMKPSLYLGFIGLVLGTLLVRIATDHHWPDQLPLMVTLLVLALSWVGTTGTYRTALARAIQLRGRTEALAAGLRAEKAAAEEARRVAEEARHVAEEARRAAEAANRAKTQFFAAASHDLRQPLHAMGLFAEALRQRTHDPEVTSLVLSINASVDALEGLFGELLDLTRIDAGGVDVNPQPVRIGELFARLQLQFEPVAFEKGLMLAFRGEQQVALADPVLLERVLRNLLSNAIRYTDDGGVLVSCRRRRLGGADMLLLQVWDSGIGITEANLPHIFDEFYQVQNHRPLEPHLRKGLGLGLAIVKRLAGLMGAQVSVRSRVGHGTVFSLIVPLGRLSGSFGAPKVHEASLPIELTLHGRLIVVVEDAAAVREGVVVLLQGWGARVEAFETVSALTRWLASSAAEPPDLLLLDYRLSEGQTGLDALRAARAHWPERHLPAVVITGSGLAGLEDMAVANDYHLLLKPVLPNKLRAMIAFKLGGH